MLLRVNSVRWKNSSEGGKVRGGNTWIGRSPVLATDTSTRSRPAPSAAVASSFSPAGFTLKAPSGMEMDAPCRLL